MNRISIGSRVWPSCLRFAAVAIAVAISWATAAASVRSAPPQSSHTSTQTAKKKVKHRPRRVPGQKAPSADRIQEIQSALSREGYYKGDPSGKWDSDTQEAMRRFQEEHDLTGTGKLDAQSLQKLGLGSDIAGVSAPRPPQTPAPQSKPEAPASSSSGATGGSTSGGTPSSSKITGSSPSR
jgi:peptidoglycan hydrolase-like protein with peptidoglycan-binding domain